MAVAEATLIDGSGSIKIIWFHQPYLARMLHSGSLIRASGKVADRKGSLYIANPEVEVIPEIPKNSGELFGEEDVSLFAHPVYPESRGISSGWLHYAIQKVIRSGVVEQIPDRIPVDILKRYHLPTLKASLIWVHSPQKEKDKESARKRFAFEEVFFIQLAFQEERRLYQEKPSFRIDKKPEDLGSFISRFPFKETGAQKRAIKEILSDFGSGRAMSRLLEGDVGSGKTAVAATTAYAAITTPPASNKYGSLQVGYMAPTEILATQHFENFIQYFRHMPIEIGLITGSGCRKFPSKVSPEGWTDISRAQLLKWVAEGKIAILLGTHALIQKSVRFKNLAYIIIDEQHRFGVRQRMSLAKKEDIVPHLLSMTATPIPRTLALTIYGDLDLTLLDEMPAGRKPVITEVLETKEREVAYEKIRSELKAGRQAYIICPRIDEPDPDKPARLNDFSRSGGEFALEAKSVKAEAERLKKNIFKGYEIDILHSKMKSDDKDGVMDRFSKGEVDILIATSVVEVGVNVPNATVIIIEGAERFGLAQLHQLRGRVLRSTHQSHCFLFAETKSGKTMQRLKAFLSAKNGFELAEKDLELRGAGELGGRKQWGLTDIGMEAIKNLKMVEAARKEAAELVFKDPGLAKHPALKEASDKRRSELHFE